MRSSGAASRQCEKDFKRKDIYFFILFHKFFVFINNIQTCFFLGLFFISWYNFFPDLIKKNLRTGSDYSENESALEIPFLVHHETFRKSSNVFYQFPNDMTLLVNDSFCLVLPSIQADTKLKGIEKKIFPIKFVSPD